MNYRSLLDIIMFKFFTLTEDVYVENNSELLEIGNNLYTLLSVYEQNSLLSYYMNQFSQEELNDMNEEVDINVGYPELTITQDIIDNFPSEKQIKQLLFNKHN